MKNKLSKNPNWKGGVTITSHGYRKIKKPSHPRADVSGYVYEHRLIVEKKIGRFLYPTEIVHHKDKNKLNNNLSNLKILSSMNEHKLLHRKRECTRKLPDQSNYKIACGCGCGKKFKKYDKYGRLRKFAWGGHASRGRHYFDVNETVICACGCGVAIKKYDKSGRIRKYISGHNRRKNNEQNTH